MTDQSLETVTKRSRQEWAGIINTGWHKGVRQVEVGAETLLETGKDLIAAKHDLLDGTFLAMCEKDLDFTPHKAQALMRLSTRRMISNALSRSYLPSGWRIVGTIMQLSDDDFKWALERKLITNKTSLRAADAIQGALKIPKGATWGKDRKPSTLPKPEEARQIARETGRFVAASNDRIYSGATEEEGAEADRCIAQTYKIIDAIEAIADIGMTQKQWLQEAQDFQLHKFRLTSLEAAIEWLLLFQPALKRHQGIIDNGQ